MNAEELWHPVYLSDQLVGRLVQRVLRFCGMKGDGVNRLRFSCTVPPPALSIQRPQQTRERRACAGPSFALHFLQFCPVFSSSSFNAGVSLSFSFSRA